MHCSNPQSDEPSSVGRALKDWLLGTQATPACEAGAFIRDRLATAHRSLYGGVSTMPRKFTRSSGRLPMTREELRRDIPPSR